jgi:Holliday junction DNA helicase RuvB
MESTPPAAVERMIPGLPREEVIEALYILNRQGETSQRKLAFYLLDFQKRKLFRPEARDAVQWARKHLELKDARRLLRLAERLAELPLLDGAFARGEVGWTKCREVSRVATADIDAIWTEYARTHNSREVEAATSGRQRGQRPGEGGPRARRTRLQVQLGLDAEGEATWEAAVRKVRKELGPGSTPSDVLVALSRRALEGEPETPDSKRRRRDPATTVVFHCAPDKAVAWLDTRRGPVEVAPEVIHRKVQEGATVYHAPDVEGAGPCEAIRWGERGQVPPEDRDTKVSPALKKAVLARDGHRCVLCGSSRSLMPHHLDSWAHGGQSRAERLVTLCDHCHGGCHEGLLQLWVEEDGQVTARDPDGEVVSTPRAPLRVEAPSSPESVVERVEVPQSVSSQPEPPVGPTLRELPAELTAEAWRELGGRLAWSAREHAFVLSDGTVAGCSEVEASKPADSLSSPPSPTRPGSFQELVAQRPVVSSLLLAARAARRRGEVLGHVLLSGPPGVGKTTIARLLCTVQGTGFQETVAGHVGEAHRLVELLVGLRHGDILFLDEIHRLRGSLQETLYTALEDGFVDVLVSDRAETRRIRIRLEAFTLVGATTRPGALSEPFRGRFPHSQRLLPYSVEQLSELVARTAKKLEVSLAPKAALEIARRSRATPREAIRILEHLRDWAQVSEIPVVKYDHVVVFTTRLGIDALGLHREDQQILGLLLEEGKPLGQEALAARLGLDLETLRDVHEPWLERLGLVERTRLGRVATEKARELYGGRARRRAVGER